MWNHVETRGNMWTNVGNMWETRNGMEDFVGQSSMVSFGQKNIGGVLCLLQVGPAASSFKFPMRHGKMMLTYLDGKSKTSHSVKVLREWSIAG